MMLLVRYWDHTSTLEFEKIAPSINEVMGRFVKTEMKEKKDFMVLSMDWSENEPLLPYSTILWDEIISVHELVIVR